MASSAIYSPTVPRDLKNEIQNTSFPDGCIKMESTQFSAWNNSVISTDVMSYASKISSCFVLIFLVIGGTGNVINMAVFSKQGLRDRVNLVLFSLSLSDEVKVVMMTLLCGDGIELLLTGERAGTPLMMFLTNYHLLVFGGSTFISIVLSAIIACERCYCVLRPLKYQTLMRTRTMACIIVIACVIIIGLYYISILRYYYVCGFDPDTLKITYNFVPSEFYRRHRNLVDYIGNIVFGAGVTVGVLIVVVTATAVTVWKLRQSVAWRSETSSSISSKEVALTKMLVGTSVLLIICLFPNVLFRIARAFFTDVNIGRRNMNLYLVCLSITDAFLTINSSSNIFIYYVMGSRYRETFWTLFKIKRRVSQRKNRMRNN